MSRVDDVLLVGFGFLVGYATASKARPRQPDTAPDATRDGGEKLSPELAKAPKTAIHFENLTSFHHTGELDLVSLQGTSGLLPAAAVQPADIPVEELNALFDEAKFALRDAQAAILQARNANPSSRCLFKASLAIIDKRRNLAQGTIQAVQDAPDVSTAVSTINEDVSDLKRAMQAMSNTAKAETEAASILGTADDLIKLFS